MKTMTAAQRRLFLRIAKRCAKTEAHIYTHEVEINDFVRAHLNLFITHPDVDPANPDVFMFQLSERGRALLRKLTPPLKTPKMPAIPILLIAFACLSANAAFAQQAPGHYVNSSQHLEDVPGTRKPDIRKIVPMRDFMSVEQYELTLPTRARLRGFTIPSKQPAQSDHSPKGQPTTVREEHLMPCGRIIILYKEHDAIPASVE